MRIIATIASSTHIDAHNERFAKEALESMITQIRTKYLPCLIDHDPSQQIGVVFNGKIRQMKDGEFALVTVVGVFEQEAERELYTPGSLNTVWQQYESFLDEVEMPNIEESARTQPKSKPLTIAGLLEQYLDSTSIWVDSSVYKIKHLIASTGDLSVHVYPKDHLPAHFHLTSKQRNIDARFSIYTIEFIDTKRGSIRPGDVKKIQDFFRRNPKELQKLQAEHARLQ
ncbi:MAG: hypothetical protein P4M11_05715 [Candidatus Pacebacteria bacterium]|nr:hypothetical protein [Candidatus Paceibacterota bacterium]